MNEADLKVIFAIDMPKTFKPKSMSSKKATKSDTYFRKQADVGYNRSQIKSNKENTTSIVSVQKRESSSSYSAKNQGFKVKTMSGLSAKNQKGGKNILDSLTKTNKRISSY